MHSTNPQTAPQIVYVTDRGLIRPTLISAWSLLRHISVAPDIHIWGDGLTEDDWSGVARVIASHPDAKLHRLDLGADDMAGARRLSDHISAAAMGRLHIPAKLGGRVLYIDGDTIVTGDVAPLFDIDMRGQPLAAVRDYVVAKWQARGDLDKPRIRPRVAELRRLMGDDISGYFNSGVLLLDCDAIRAEPALLAAMGDVARASACPWGDQDHLNNVFAGRVHHLNAAWNDSWGRTPRQRRFSAAIGGTGDETAKRPSAIVHFHGPKKPWKAPRRDLWSQRARAAWRYRRDMADFLKAFPDLQP